MQNVRLASYLDDWLVVNVLKKMLLSDREKTLNLLVQLGFIINLKKSSLVPKQVIIHIGNLFDFNQGLVMPTQERIDKLEKAIHVFIQGKISAYHYLHLLGLMAPCIEIIPNARLYMRPLQLHMLAHWKPTSRDMQRSMNVTITITTDSSKTGYGGRMNDKMIFQGSWSHIESNQHINVLEMEAVLRTVKHFLPYLQGQHVLIRSDNTTVVQFTNQPNYVT